MAGSAHVLDALVRPDPLSAIDTVVQEAVLPRILLAWLVGAAMGVAAVLLQQVLVNPLASPTTFGVSGGAGLALALAVVLAPGVAATHRAAIALAGAAVAMAVVSGIALRHRFAPLRLALAGLLVSLACGTGLSCLFLFQGRSLGALAIWGAGSLDQEAARTLRLLWPQLLGGTIAALLIARPLQAMQIGEDGARGLGVPVAWVRAAAASLAVWLAAAAVGAAGIIGFVDLCAAASVRLAGIAKLRDRVLWALPVGAAMLWLTDVAAQLLGRGLGVLMPTGAVAGLVGAPILVVLAARARTVPIAETRGRAERRRRGGRGPLVLLALSLLLAVGAALAFGRGPEGWHLSLGDELASLAPWRVPRVAAAAAAGILLALAGVTTQRLVGNPMASPELLGVGAAASMAICLLLVVAPGAGRTAQLLTGLASAGAVLFLLLALGRRSGFDPTGLVLTGVGLSAALGTGLSVIVALVPFESARVLSWLAGSTYDADATSAVSACALAVLGLAVVPFVARWLDIIPLGRPLTVALGVHLTWARGLLLLLSAGLTASGTLLIGPFAFVGLMAPHLARLAGFHRARGLALASALIGAIILVLADLLARNVFFPYQLPTGTLATAVGLLPLLWLIAR